MKKQTNNMKNLIIYGLVGLLIGLVLGILLSNSFAITGNATGVMSNNKYNTSPPVPAQIVEINAKYTDCTQGDKSYFTFSWKPLGNNEMYKAYILNSSNKLVELKLLSENNIGFPAGQLDPKMPKNVQGYAFLTNQKCGDAYYLYIDSVKNNQTVTSQGNRFSWVD